MMAFHDRQRCLVRPLSDSVLSYSDDLMADVVHHDHVAVEVGAAPAQRDGKGPAGPVPVSYKQLFRYSTTFDRLLLAFGVTNACVAGAAYPYMTVVFGDILNTLAVWQATEGRHTVAQADNLAQETADKTLYFLYLGALTFVCTYFYMAPFVYASERQAHEARQRYLKGVLRQDIAWFDKVGAGEVATRITTDTLLIQDAIGDKVPLCVSQVATFVSGFVIAFVKSWKLTLILMTVIPFVVVSAGVMNVLAGRLQVRILALYSSAGSTAEETIAAVRTVAAFGAQARMSTRYGSLIQAARAQGIRKATAIGVGLGVMYFLVYCCYSLAFYYGYILLDNHETDAGKVVNVFFSVIIGAFALGHIAPDLQAFALGRSAGAKLFETIDRVPPIDSCGRAARPIGTSGFLGRIALRDVTFRYPARPDVPVLNGVSLTIEPGTTVALVGPSGSGKSTIVQLVERFYDPVEGSVEVDGIPMTELDLASLRRHVGLVAQEPVLFEGTVSQNVAMGLLGTELEGAAGDHLQGLIVDACQQANAHDFITRLPDGYATSVGERGALLSGGQKQRIAIARAIIKNPQVLLLDEATSALDSASESVVQDALDRVSRSRTTITIAHRLATIRNADSIVVLDRGRIVEQGRHADLIARGGPYFHLVEAQRLRNAQDDHQVPPPRPAAPGSPSGNDDEESTHPASASSSPSSIVQQADGDGKRAPLSSWAVFKYIMRLNAPERRYMIVGTLAAVASGMVHPVFAIIFSSVIETFAEVGPALARDSKLWSLCFLLLAAGVFLACVVQNAMFGYASENLTERIRRRVFAAVLRQDMAFFDRAANTTGALTANLSSDAQRVQGASGSTMATLLQVSTTLVGGIVVSLVYGWKLALVATACLPLLLLANYFRHRIITYFADRTRATYERSSQVACEAVAGIRTVQSLCAEAHVHRQYEAVLRPALRDGYRNARLNTLLYAFTQSVSFVIIALIFWYGGRLIAYEGYSIKQLYTVFVAIVFGAMSVGRIFSSTPDLAKAKDAGAIRAAPGQFVALVGPSGCGKSTMIGLLERFYALTGGAILLDGRPIDAVDVGSYRDVIGVVSQEPNLFGMTIQDNIALGCAGPVTDEQVEGAATQANAHDFIMSLPDGYQTAVGTKGAQLSGGQKQRIAIARALIRQPKLLLLDEATSALDATSERVVQDALDRAAKGRTTIAVAHRLSTIQNADVIYVLKDGAVHEQGTHKQLLDKGGLYRELVAQQDLHAPR
ncbi:hypothetical protein PBRA_008264 [Plasmodiophora brassicae]|uniref:Uncharacterized protein n=1 Tax=Plasmodiophora brassicae TaxID=37360 RepID=A0A0G4J0B2_PLABS|nr:hypothetical protein PBRA_008264 [Plasmodiophora brassicae]